MDSTLFEFRTGFSENPKPFLSHSARPQRPVSAQSYKIKPHVITPTASEGPKVFFTQTANARPNTASHRQIRFVSNEMPRNAQVSLMGELRPEEEARLMEVAYGETSQMQEIHRMMPKHIKFDKEKLYEDTLLLKQTINGLKEENMKLKAKNLSLEKENIKMVKSLEKMGNSPIIPGKQNEGALIVALKKQVKDLKEELMDSQREIESMKKNTNYTKFQELEIQLKAYENENVRIRAIFDEYMRNRAQMRENDFHNEEERYYTQNNLVDILQRENAKLVAHMKDLEDENEKLEAFREVDRRKIEKLHRDVSRLENFIVKEREAEKRMLNHRPESPSVPKSAMKNEEKPKGEEEIITELKRHLDYKEQIIIQREKALEDLRQKFNEKLANEIKEKQNHISEINKLKDQQTELEAKYRALLTVQHMNEEKRRVGDGRSSMKYDEDLPSDPRGEKSFGFEVKTKKVKRVMFDDVSSLGYELSLKLRVRRIAFEEIMRFFDRYGTKATINEMKNILTHEPFGMKDENNALLIARYLIEPNDEEVLTFDVNRTQDLNIIKSVFRKLVGSYTLLGEEEEKTMNNQVGEIIHKYEQGLQAQFGLIPESKTGYLSSEQIAKAFKILDTGITQKNFEYLIMNLYEYTGNLKKLDFNKMFEVFETEEHKRLKKIIEMYQNQNDGDSERSDRRTKLKDNNE